MTIRRYARVPQLKGGLHLGTSEVNRIIWENVESGAISVTIHTMQEGERLDILAGQNYGDGRLWWVIAAASGIGWALQVPPGTRVRIPTNLASVTNVIG